MTPPTIPTQALVLLHSFNYLTLGEGDHAAGMNVLVSMCAALSAAAGPDARVTTDEGIELRPGVHWLVAGSLSAALHEQHVIAPIREMQNVFAANLHLTKLKMPGYIDSTVPQTLAHTDLDRKIPAFTPGLLSTARDRMILGQIRDRQDDGRDFTGVASLLLGRGTLQSPPDFYHKGGFFYDGSDPRVLAGQLLHAHRCHPLVDFPLNTKNQVINSGAAALGIMDGRALPTSPPTHVRGIATVRLGQFQLSELAAGQDENPWLNRMLWLAELPQDGADVAKDILTLDAPSKRFRAALEEVLSSRLGEQPILMHVDKLLPHQHSFVRHLGSLEPSVPGIAGTLKNLVPTLFFGLRQVAAATPLPAGFKLDPRGVVQLAKYLADRMVSIALFARHADQQERRKRLALSFCSKLAERPHTDRELVRRHDKLPIGLARDVLSELEALGRVKAISGTWHLSPLSGLVKPQPPTIDVT